jgi:hypothetical protein
MSRRAWVATRKGLFELRRSRSRWEIAAVSFLGEPVTAVLPPDPLAPGRPMIAALNLGHFGVKCHASDDQGRNWREVGTPAWPLQDPAEHDDIAWKLIQVWELAGKGDDIWAGTLPGGLFRSSDGGASWRLNEPLWTHPRRREWSGGGYDVPGIHSIVLDPRDREPGSQRLLVGVSTGGVWRSPDGGATWAARASGMRADYMPPEQARDDVAQDVHRIVACAASPDHLWCQHHNGIWRSVDCAASWQQVTGVPVSDFGFTVAVDPGDPTRAWFVPAVADQRRVPAGAALAVLRTDDGGRSFTALRAGLPQSHSYDLVYRHGLDVGSDGRTLMMGSTTGSLWTSSDRGDRWKMISSSLPPINSVVVESS